MITTEPIIVGNELAVGTLMYEGQVTNNGTKITLDKPFDTSNTGLYLMSLSGKMNMGTAGYRQMDFPPVFLIVVPRDDTTSQHAILTSISSTAQVYQLSYLSGTDFNITATDIGTGLKLNDIFKVRIYKICSLKD